MLPTGVSPRFHRIVFNAVYDYCKRLGFRLVYRDKYVMMMNKKVSLVNLNVAVDLEEFIPNFSASYMINDETDVLRDILIDIAEELADIVESEELYEIMNLKPPFKRALRFPLLTEIDYPDGTKYKRVNIYSVIDFREKHLSWAFTVMNRYKGVILSMDDLESALVIIDLLNDILVRLYGI